MPSVNLVLVFFQYFSKRYLKHLYRLLLLVFLKFKLIHPIFTSVLVTSRWERTKLVGQGTVNDAPLLASFKPKMKGTALFAQVFAEW